MFRAAVDPWEPMTAYYPTCPSCQGPVFAVRGHWLDSAHLRLSCGECGKSVPAKAWRSWLRA